MEIALPSDLTRRESHVLFAAWIAALIDNPDTGEVPGGRATLAAMTNVSNVERQREIIRELCRRGLLVRVGRRLYCARTPFQASNAPFSGGVSRCSSCDALQPPNRLNMRLCPRCRQAERKDRQWQSGALKMAVKQIADKGAADPRAISIACGRPLWRPLDEDDQGGAVVPFLLSHKLIGEEWLAALREALGPEEFRRLRKQRRRKEAV